MYQPNFCADCGEKIERAHWRPWTNRRFCEECERQLEPWQKRFLPALVAVFALVGIGVFAGRWTQEKRAPVIVTSVGTNAQTANAQTNSRPPAQTLIANQNQPAAPNPVQTISAVQPNQSPRQQTAAQPVSPTVQEQTSEAAYYCGARTKKGAPCTRRVKGGGRCWQHVGKPALLPPEKLLIRNG